MKKRWYSKRKQDQKKKWERLADIFEEIKKQNECLLKEKLMQIKNAVQLYSRE